MNRKDIIIKEKNINGLKHPQLSITGKATKFKKIEFEVTADGKALKYDLRKVGNHGIFVLNANLRNNEKNITIKFLVNKKEYKTIKIKNTFTVRLKCRIKYVMKKFIKPFKKIFHGIMFLWKEHHFLVPPVLWKKYLKVIGLKIKHIFIKETYNPFKVKDYNKWLKKYEKEPVYQELKYKPLISILIPVYNIEREYLSDCLDSILRQKYENFEVCLADDCSSKEETIETLKEYAEKDKRIKVIRNEKNSHISITTNNASKIAKGEFIGLMDDDDILTENCLYEMVLALNENKKLDLIYSDEDKIDMQGRRCEPHFKPDFSPDSILGGNYICHFEIIRKSLYDKVGGEKHELVGAQDFDLFLRIIDETTPDKIKHIPKILYHWRKVPGSTADTIENKEYAILAGKKAVEEAMKRRKLNAEVEVPIQSTHYIVNYKYEKEPFVSIIIPTKDLAGMLENCLSSIYFQTSYKNYEIIVVDNNSVEEKTKKLFEEYEKKHNNFRVIKYEDEFNFSKINNYAVSKAKGEYILFLNNDTEVITKNWLSKMVGYAMQKHIACVGAKLIYENDTIQHGGVILGIDGIARHAFLNYDADTYGYYGRMITPYDYSAVTAACLMVNKKKFLEVKGFNEELKVAYNDIDLNLKLRKKGYYNVFLPQVELYHYESKSRGLDTTKEKYNQYLKERKYMEKTWKEELEKDPFYNENYSKKDCFVLDR